MSVQSILRYNVDLTSPITRKPLADVLATMDDLAHRIEVKLTSGGVPVDLSAASVTAYFMRADGYTVLIPGAVDNGKACIELNANCYLIPGKFSFAMRVQIGSSRHTVLMLEGYVKTTSTDTVVDPEDVVPSLEDLLARIAEMETATESANTAAEAANEAREGIQDDLDGIRTDLGDLEANAVSIGLTVQSGMLCMTYNE